MPEAFSMCPDWVDNKVTLSHHWAENQIIGIVTYMLLFPHQIYLQCIHDNLLNPEYTVKPV